MSTDRPPLLSLVALIIAESGEDWIQSADLARKLHHIDPDGWPSPDESMIAAQQHLARVLCVHGIRPHPSHLVNNRAVYRLKDVAPGIWEQILAIEVGEITTESSPPVARYEQAVRAVVKRAASAESPRRVRNRLDIALKEVADIPLIEERQPDPCGVYAYDDPNGVLLYVGITNDDDRRDVQHMRAQPWARFVANRRTLGTYAYRDSAAADEARLIAALRPIFNRTRPGWMPEAIEYLVAHNALDLLTVRGLSTGRDTSAVVRELVAVGAHEFLEIVVTESP